MSRTRILGAFSAVILATRAMAAEPVPAAPAQSPPQAQGEAGGEGAETFMSGGELLEVCRAPTAEAPLAPNAEQLCFEFIYGIAQTVTAMQQSDPSVQLFCIDPQTTAIEQVRNHLRDGLNARKDRLTEPAYVLTLEVLGAAYPCMSFDRL
jgi:hypothetical protein